MANMFIFVVQGADGRYYCDMTDDLPKKMKEFEGKSAKRLEIPPPYNLVFSQEFSSKTEAKRAVDAIRRQSNEETRLMIKRMISAQNE